ncbi:hypothetical protein S83_003237, partial [Arachis hypogaea]
LCLYHLQSPLRCHCTFTSVAAPLAGSTSSPPLASHVSASGRLCLARISVSASLTILSRACLHCSSAYSLSSHKASTSQTFSLNGGKKTYGRGGYNPILGFENDVYFIASIPYTSLRSHLPV